MHIILRFTILFVLFLSGFCIAQNNFSNPIFFDRKGTETNIFSIQDSIKKPNVFFDKLRNKTINIGTGRITDGEQFQKEPTFQALLSPIFKTEIGYDTYKKAMANELGIGAKLNLNYKNKIVFSAAVFQSNATFNSYYDSVITKTNMVPFAGYAHGLANNHFYYWNNSFSLSYKAGKYLVFSFANAKNFLGDGYRSLLLSNNANNYPHLKIDANIWKFKYTAIFSNLYDIRLSNGNFNNYNYKYASMHYFKWQVFKKLELSFYEAIIFQSRKQKGFGYDINYLNPFIFYRPVEYSLGSSDNAILGGNLKFNYKPNITIYAQFVLDEFYVSRVRERKGWIDNKQGVQLGVKGYKTFGKHHFNFLAEVNYVRPYVYSHGNALQNYSNFNMPLAHPFGANFYEVLAMIKYKSLNYMQINATISYALIGYDKGGVSYGQNINESYALRVIRKDDNGSFVGQGLQTKQLLLFTNAIFAINKTNNTCLSVGLMLRHTANELGNKFIAYPHIGFSTLVFGDGGIF